jgi:hypothetical protein
MRQFHVPQSFTLNDAARAAVKAFRDSKPWRGTGQERLKKFETLHRGLCRAFDCETILDGAVAVESTAPSFDSTSDPRRNRITLKGRLSVVTYLWAFIRCTGQPTWAALAKAKAIFKHFFPRSFARCKEVNGMLVRLEDLDRPEYRAAFRNDAA